MEFSEVFRNMDFNFDNEYLPCAIATGKDLSLAPDNLSFMKMPNSDMQKNSERENSGYLENQVQPVLKKVGMRGVLAMNGANTSKIKQIHTYASAADGADKYTNQEEYKKARARQFSRDSRARKKVYIQNLEREVLDLRNTDKLKTKAIRKLQEQLKTLQMQISGEPRRKQMESRQHELQLIQQQQLDNLYCCKGLSTLPKT